MPHRISLFRGYLQESKNKRCSNFAMDLWPIYRWLFHWNAHLFGDFPLQCLMIRRVIIGWLQVYHYGCLRAWTGVPGGGDWPAPGLWQPHHRAIVAGYCWPAQDSKDQERGKRHWELSDTNMDLSNIHKLMGRVFIFFTYYILYTCAHSQPRTYTHRYIYIICKYTSKSHSIILCLFFGGLPDTNINQLEGSCHLVSVQQPRRVLLNQVWHWPPFPSPNWPPLLVKWRHALIILQVSSGC